jgi:hypothetical protein
MIADRRADLTCMDADQLGEPGEQARRANGPCAGGRRLTSGGVPIISLFPRKLSQQVKFGKVHFLNKWTSGKMTSFSQQMVLGDILARRATVTELRSRRTCVQTCIFAGTLSRDVH